MLRIRILTLFPEMFRGVLNESIIKRAQDQKLADIEVVNFRDYATDKHRTVDDYPFGGGAGMLLKPAPIFAAVDAVVASLDGEFGGALHRDRDNAKGIPDLPGDLDSQTAPATVANRGETVGPPSHIEGSEYDEIRDTMNAETKEQDIERPKGEGPKSERPLTKAAETKKHEIKEPETKRRREIALMSPQGQPFTQKIAEELSELDELVLICGHYEGFDERIREFVATRELSVGDFVVTGGEIPAMAVMDAVVRLLPGALGNKASAEEDSFSSGLLEHPQYTRPADYLGYKVPDVLLSGDHAKVAKWRHEQSLYRTWRRRPDLLNKAALTEADRRLIERWESDAYIGDES